MSRLPLFPINQAGSPTSTPIYPFPLLPSRLLISLFTISHLSSSCRLVLASWRLSKVCLSSGLELRLFHLTPLLDPGLIRHGKAHQDQKQDKPDIDFASPEHQQPYQQQRQHRAVPPKERDNPDPSQPYHEPKEHKKVADYSREAEIIVKEERQAKSSIPQYKGLELYRILDKMGESVALSRHG